MAAGKQSAWTGCSRFTSFHNKKCQHQAIKASAPSFNLSWTLSPQLFLQSTGSCDSMQSSHQLRPRIFVAFDGPLWRQPSDTCHGPLFGPLEHSACASDIKWLSALNASWLLWYLIFCYVNVVNVLSWGTTHESPVVSLPWAGRLHLNQILYTQPCFGCFSTQRNKRVEKWIHPPWWNGRTHLSTWTCWISVNHNMLEAT